MPVNVQITQTGISPIKFTKILEETIEKVDQSLSSLADGAVSHMRGVIKTKTYRSGSTGELAKSIEVSKIEGGYGIGDISYMDTNVPYWAIINYGGWVPLATNGRLLYGSFEGQAPDFNLAGSNPGAGSQGFNKGMYPLHRMRPKFPISPKNYIEDTVSWIVSYMDGYNLAASSKILP